MNYEFKGTPGPWRIQTQADNEHIGLLEDGKPYNGVVDCKHGYYGTTAKGFNFCGIISEETAHLISAAPCLLEAAIDVLNHAVNNGAYLASESELIVFNRLKSAVEKSLNINQ